MLMKVVKIEGDNSKPNEIEMETKFNIGDKFVFEYDWCTKKSCMNGYKNNWHKDTTEVEVVDIVCNMLVNPHLVEVIMKTEDELFIERCKCNEFHATEEQVLRRITF